VRRKHTFPTECIKCHAVFERWPSQTLVCPACQKAAEDERVRAALEKVR